MTELKKVYFLAIVLKCEFSFNLFKYLLVILFFLRFSQELKFCTFTIEEYYSYHTLNPVNYIVLGKYFLFVHHLILHFNVN